ncbi:MAG: hypothetical protein AAGL10_04515 [Pseudomonadota bacterium]
MEQEIRYTYCYQSPVKTFSLLLLPLVLAGCDGTSESQRTSEPRTCEKRFNNPATGGWAKRMLQTGRKGTVTLTYGVDFSFDDPKRLENALALLPGASQELSFQDDGSVRAVITGMSVPIGVVSSSDGKTNIEIPIAKTVCGAVAQAKGVLVFVSVHTKGYEMDSGKLWVTPVP